MGKNKGDKTKSLTVRFPPGIHATLERLAEIETRSINEQVLHFVKMGLMNIENDVENTKGGNAGEV